VSELPGPFAGGQFPGRRRGCARRPGGRASSRLL